EFIEHKARDEQHTVEEAGLADVGNAPVDDRAGVDEDILLGRGFLVGLHEGRVGQVGGVQPAEDVEEFGAAHHHQVDAEIAEDDGRRGRQQAPQVVGQLAERDGKEGGHDQAQDQANGGGQDVGGGDEFEPS